MGLAWAVRIVFRAVVAVCRAVGNLSLRAAVQLWVPSQLELLGTAVLKSCSEPVFSVGCAETCLAMRLVHLATAAVALQAPPTRHVRTRRLQATHQLDVGCWMLLVPELNALPGRHAYDQTEFLNTDEILDRVDSIDEAAVLSTCDRYCVFVATKKNLTEALRDVETVVSREIAVRAGRTGS